MRQTARVRGALVIVGLSALLAACGQGDVDDASPTPTSPPVEQPAPLWPLTGLEADDASADVTGPALMVKVDNVSAAFPQLGLDSADVVVEEPVEGGVTRLAVFFHSSVGQTVGPVRSLRSSDVGIAKPADAVLVASGGAGEALADVEQAGIVTYLEGETGFVRDGSRSAPHNLFVDVGQVVADVDAQPGPPGPLVEIDPDVDLPEGAPVDSLALTFSPAQRTVLDLDGQTWSRRLATPDGFAADTVVVLTIEQGTAGYLDPSGSPVPINITEGAGTGWLVHGGQVIEVEWTKESAQSPWALSTMQGPLGVPPGRTYVALLPQSTGSLQVLSPEATPQAG